MPITLTRAVERESGFIDYRTRRPYIVRLEVGGRLVRLRVKGRRRATAYTVTVEQLVHLGAVNAAAELRRKRLEKRADRKALAGR